jgi:hypothetical protein
VAPDPLDKCGRRGAQSEAQFVAAAGERSISNQLDRVSVAEFQAANAATTDENGRVTAQRVRLRADEGL